MRLAKTGRNEGTNPSKGKVGGLAFSDVRVIHWDSLGSVPNPSLAVGVIFLRFLGLVWNPDCGFSQEIGVGQVQNGMYSRPK